MKKITKLLILTVCMNAAALNGMATIKYLSPYLINYFTCQREIEMKLKERMKKLAIKNFKSGFEESFDEYGQLEKATEAIVRRALKEMGRSDHENIQVKLEDFVDHDVRARSKNKKVSLKSSHFKMPILLDYKIPKLAEFMLVCYHEAAHIALLHCLYPQFSLRKFNEKMHGMFEMEANMFAAQTLLKNGHRKVAKIIAENWGFFHFDRDFLEFTWQYCACKFDNKEFKPKIDFVGVHSKSNK